MHSACAVPMHCMCCVYIEVISYPSTYWTMNFICFEALKGVETLGPSLGDHLVTNTSNHKSVGTMHFKWQ